MSEELTCEDCGARDETVEIVYCPYAQDIYDELIEVTICSKCCEQRALDV